MDRLRPLALQGGVLMAILLVYLVLAAALTPADMGKGPLAEMRYVVPLIALGAAVAGLTLVILRWLFWPAALVAFVLLVGTNWLHLGFLADRENDNAKAWWPPTLYRSVTEIFHDHQTGNEAIVGLLRPLPAGTTVRVWPEYMVYPAMFYARHLHYCDQLAASKRIKAELKPLPDYLYLGRVRPDVILIPLAWVAHTLADLDLRYGVDSYRVCNALLPLSTYTSKPEIPLHVFTRPAEWSEFVGMVVLVRRQSPVAGHKALATDPTDPDALGRLALALKEAWQLEDAERSLRAALRIDAEHVESRFQLGTLLLNQGKLSQALPHLQTTLRLKPDHAYAHLNLGVLRLKQRRPDEARRHYRDALRYKPDFAKAYFNLGNIAEGIDRAVVHYQAALKAEPEYAEAHVNLGVALLKKGNLDESITHLRSAVRIKPSMAEAHVGLARALHADGDERAAVKEFRAALELVNPNSVWAKQIRASLEELEH